MKQNFGENKENTILLPTTNTFGPIMNDFTYKSKTIQNIKKKHK